MKRVIFLLTFISVCIAASAAAFERALPMDFIFKGGDYKEKMAMSTEAPITARIEGDDGAVYYLKFMERSELRHTGTDENGIETYSARTGSFEISSDEDDGLSDRAGAGLIYEPVTSSLAWFVSPDPEARPDKKWTAELSDVEYQFIGVLSTITVDVGAKAVLVQYSGLDPETGDIVLEITDASASEPVIRRAVEKEALPGYIQIPGGGILGIEKAEDEDGIPVLSYEWIKEPPI